MDTKHTPGPWTLEAGRNFITSSGEFYITYGQDRYKNPKFKDFCELDANARLIAAAPDMLSALKAYQVELEERLLALGWDSVETYHSYCKPDESYSLICAAIAKAEGK
jgi:hypothetical protein